MENVSYKDFDILSEQDKAEAVALINRYDQLEKQSSCQSDFMNFIKLTILNMWLLNSISILEIL